VLLLAVLIVAFATLVTVHLALAAGLARRNAWRGLLAFVIVPLAPWWGWRERMRVRSILWAVAAVVYGGALGLSLRGG